MTSLQYISVILHEVTLKMTSFAASSVKAGQVSLKTKPSSSGGPLCTTVKFSTSFAGVTEVKVFVSLSHEGAFSEVHVASVPWVESVTINGFKACIVETGDGSKNSAVVNWLAFQGSPRGLECGSVLFPLLSTGTLCKSVFPSKVSM